MDPWLCACAVATAAERKLHALAPDIAGISREKHGEVADVARAAAAALADDRNCCSNASNR